MTTRKDILLARLARNGSLVISEGTLTTYDLFFDFVDVLETLNLAAYQQLMFPCGMTPDYLRAVDEGRNADFWASADAEFILNEVADCLQAAAPEGYYFGAHEGDGACFGFWTIEE